VNEAFRQSVELALEDFNKAMGNIHKDKTTTGRPISSYNNALLDQLSVVLERVFALYKAYENTKTPNT
jgi:hypothetical protein